MSRLKTEFREKSTRRVFTLDEYGVPRRARALLVEDDRTTRRLVRASLGDDCDLLVAGSASLGATMFRKSMHDIVFLDLGLPDGSGYNLLKWMLNVDPEAFVVIFTGDDTTKMFMSAIEAGAKGYVTKPFDRNKMLFFLRKSVDGLSS